jgi:hypothetical protein
VPRNQTIEVGYDHAKICSRLVGRRDRTMQYTLLTAAY